MRNIAELNAYRPSVHEVQMCAVFLVCFVNRAVSTHKLDIVEDLSTEAFIRAFDRLVSRRGVPVVQVHYSDNATNFVGIKKIL